MNESRVVRAALAVITACTATTSLYALLRIGQKVLGNEPDPALVIWSEHSGYFWRAWTSAYVGGMIGIATYLASRRSPGRVARVLATAVVVATILIAVQGLLVP